MRGRWWKQQHGKPRLAARAKPDPREGQAGPDGVAERPVVAEMPGNAGGAKGPRFERSVERRKGPWGLMEV